MFGPCGYHWLALCSARRFKNNASVRITLGSCRHDVFNQSENVVIASLPRFSPWRNLTGLAIIIMPAVLLNRSRAPRCFLWSRAAVFDVSWQRVRLYLLLGLTLRARISGLAASRFLSVMLRALCGRPFQTECQQYRIIVKLGAAVSLVMHSQPY
jgi:hypothetical protein